MEYVWLSSPLVSMVGLMTFFKQPTIEQVAAGAPPRRSLYLDPSDSTLDPLQMGWRERNMSPEGVEPGKFGIPRLVYSSYAHGAQSHEYSANRMIL